MPRTRRVWVPGHPHHFISRFVDRRFHLLDNTDRDFYLHSIGRATERWDWEILSYALMSSHVHYGTLAGAVDPDRFFRSAHTRVACQFHKRHSPKTLGPVFAGRPASYLVHPTMRARMVGYHHRNPADAGVVARPRDSRWTSHRAYLRLDPAPKWLNVARALSYIGFDDTESGRKQFDEFVIEGDFSGASEMGCGPFAEDRGYVFTTGAQDVCWSSIEAAARAVTGLPENIPIHSASRRSAWTRKVVAIVTTVHLCHPQAVVADRFGMHAGSVSNMILRARGNAEIASAVERVLAILGSV